MTLMQQARSWWRGDSRPARSRHAALPRHRCRPRLEQLEDRTTPAILGAPVPFVSLQSFSANGGQLAANWLVQVPGGAQQTVTTPVTISGQQTVRHAGMACPVLNLNLGPLHLDVLGLVVDLQPVTLKVQAIPGPGQLLGNLLCGPAGRGSRLLGNLVGELNNLLQVGNHLAGLVTPASSLGAGAPLNVQQLSAALTSAGVTAGTSPVQVLNLTTGPIDLNLLGLDVSVPTGINLKITAIPSSQPGGGLLGDLLAGLSHALDNPAAVAGKLSGLNLGNILSGLLGPVLGGASGGPLGISPLNLGAGLTRGALNGRGVGHAAMHGRTCNVLSLTVGPINLNLLGLQVTTSPICLRVTAQRGAGNLLGNLLCSPDLRLRDLLGAVTGLLNNLEHSPNVLGGLTGATGSLTNAGILQQLLNVLAGNLANTTNPTAATSVLHLVLGPLHLDLLGLIVDLNNCNNGPVTVDVTAIPGPGNLLGNLLGDLGRVA